MGLFARRLETSPAAPAPKRARNSVTSAEPQYLTVVQAKALAAELHDLIAWVLGAMGEEFGQSNPSRSHLFDLLGRSATGSPARQTVAPQDYRV